MLFSNNSNNSTINRWINCNNASFNYNKHSNSYKKTTKKPTKHIISHNIIISPIILLRRLVQSMNILIQEISLISTSSSRKSVLVMIIQGKTSKNNRFRCLRNRPMRIKRTLYTSNLSHRTGRIKDNH